jgi:hypothetical protein
LDFSADLQPEDIGLYNKKTIEKINASIKRKSVMVFPNKMFGDMIDDKPDLGFQKKRKPLVKSEFEGSFREWLEI